MTNYLSELQIRSEAGDINAQVDLLFRTMYDLSKFGDALSMARNWKHIHPLFGVMYDYWNTRDFNKSFLDFKYIEQTEQNDTINSFALVMVGYCTEKGRGTKQDILVGAKYCELAFAKGNPFAAHNLGIRYWDLGEYEKGMWYLLEASKKFIISSIDKIKNIFGENYHHLTPKAKASALDLFVRLSNDDMVAPFYVKKILVDGHIQWERKYHRFCTDLDMGIGNCDFQTYVLVLLCISKFRNKSSLSHVKLFYKDVAISVIQQSKCLGERLNMIFA